MARLKVDDQTRGIVEDTPGASHPKVFKDLNLALTLAKLPFKLY